MRHALSILASPQELERARLSLRANICGDCPYRTAGSESFRIDDQPTCETNCEVFAHLPQLIQAAACADPMVGNFSRVVRARIRAICDQNSAPIGTSGRRRPLIRHRRAIVNQLAKLLTQ